MQFRPPKVYSTESGALIVEENTNSRTEKFQGKLNDFWIFCAIPKRSISVCTYSGITTFLVNMEICLSNANRQKRFRTVDLIN